jgi:hypothetical protein
MICVEFKAIGPGTCRWCRKEKDQVITLAFSDSSFVGSYCFADFKKALQDKLENEEAAKPLRRGESVPLVSPANGEKS